LSAGQFDASVRHRLHQPFQIELGGDGRSRPIERIQKSRLLAQRRSRLLSDPRKIQVRLDARDQLTR
jgi:hypothetical protein